MSNKYDWYCDNCDAHLNNQAGFTTDNGTWTCTKCGYDNDVSEDNILSEHMQEFVSEVTVTCPFCGAHMDCYGSNHWECEDCGCTGVWDYELEQLMVVKYPK